MNRIEAELNEINIRYQKRDSIPNQDRSEPFYFKHYGLFEKEIYISKILSKKYTSFSQLKMIEIGAGNGANLLFFHRIGFIWENIYANELLEGRFNELSKNLSPISKINMGNALNLEYKEFFDIVFQSTVFTSVLDFSFKQKLAQKMFDMAKPGGIILWYDFKYNNPKNRDVKGVNAKEIKELFPSAKNIHFHNVTLAPPIARKIGRLYPIINYLFPFLRTHLIAVINK